MPDVKTCAYTKAEFRNVTPISTKFHRGAVKCVKFCCKNEQLLYCTAVVNVINTFVTDTMTDEQNM